MNTGVYSITNTVNGKIYIGRTTNFKIRWSLHRRELKGNRHKNSHLQNAWNLYGEKSFKFERVAVCNEELLLQVEHYWCTLLKVHNRKYGYNIEPTSNSKYHGRSPETIEKVRKSQIGKKVSEETKLKLSIINKGKILSAETIQKMINYRTGKHLSQVTKDKISKKHKGRKHPQEVINNMRKAFGRPIIVLTDMGEYVEELCTYSDAELKYKVGRGNIYKILNGKQKSGKGYQFLYKENYVEGKDYKVVRDYGKHMKKI